MTPVRKYWFWVPVRVYQVGFARVEAYSAEEAIERVEAGEFKWEETVTEIESHEVTGAPERRSQTDS